MLITDIRWDIEPEDFDSEAEYDAVNENVLPESAKIPDDVNRDEIADYLSDNYGYLVKSFVVA